MSYTKFYSLWNKVGSYTDEEFKFLKQYIKKLNYKVKYGFYNKDSAINKQIAVILDMEPNKNRKTGAENNWEIISYRTMTDKEIEEFINFYFKKSFKRFLVFYYKNVDRLVYDDHRLNAETPDEFINQCKDRGYTGSFQLKVEF